MSDPQLQKCAHCEHPAADAEHYKKEHPLPLEGPRGTYKLSWDGSVYITYTRGHQEDQ